MPSSFLSSLIHAGRNPVGVGANYVPFPKVGELRQPWADFHNPFGVDAPVSTRLSAGQRSFPKVGEYANLGLTFTTPLGLMRLFQRAFPRGNGPFPRLASTPTLG